VAGALEDTEVDGPGADGFAVLVGHDAGELVEMSEVMGGPSGEELGESDWAEGRMASAKIELVGAEIEGAEFGEIFRAHASEFIQNMREGFDFDFAFVSLAIEGIERFGFAKLQDHFYAGHPVGAFAVDEVGDDVEGRPSVWAFVGEGPRVGEIAEEGVESGGGVG
jgi:hypothetical protein